MRCYGRVVLCEIHRAHGKGIKIQGHIVDIYDPMQNKSKCRLLEGAHFVVSKDERYVLCYAWHEANRIFLNNAPCVRCLHSDLMIHDIEPKTSIQRRGIVFLKEGRLDEALKSYQSWKETAGKSLSVNEL